jgi:hypothetical protein
VAISGAASSQISVCKITTLRPFAFSRREFAPQALPLPT